MAELLTFEVNQSFGTVVSLLEAELGEERTLSGLDLDAAVTLLNDGHFPKSPLRIKAADQLKATLRDVKSRPAESLSDVRARLVMKGQLLIVGRDGAVRGGDPAVGISYEALKVGDNRTRVTVLRHAPWPPLLGKHFGSVIDAHLRQMADWWPECRGEVERYLEGAPNSVVVPVEPETPKPEPLDAATEIVGKPGPQGVQIQAIKDAVAKIRMQAGKPTYVPTSAALTYSLLCSRSPLYAALTRAGFRGIKDLCSQMDERAD